PPSPPRPNCPRRPGRCARPSSADGGSAHPSPGPWPGPPAAACRTAWPRRRLPPAPRRASPRATFPWTRSRRRAPPSSSRCSPSTRANGRSRPACRRGGWTGRDLPGGSRRAPRSSAYLPPGNSVWWALRSRSGCWSGASNRVPFVDGWVARVMRRTGVVWSAWRWSRGRFRLLRLSAGPADGVCGRLGDGGGSAGGLGQVQQGGPRQVAGFRGEGELEYGAAGGRELLDAGDGLSGFVAAVVGVGDYHEEAAGAGAAEFEAVVECVDGVGEVVVAAGGIERRHALWCSVGGPGQCGQVPVVGDGGGTGVGVGQGCCACHDPGSGGDGLAGGTHGAGDVDGDPHTQRWGGGVPAAGVGERFRGGDRPGRALSVAGEGRAHVEAAGRGGAGGPLLGPLAVGGGTQGAAQARGGTLLGGGGPAGAGDRV